MINWNEVKVGETVIVNPSNEKWLVVCRHKERVWLCRGDFFQTREERSLDRWTIDDPWEEITEECEWVKCGDTFASWYIVHKGKQTVCHDSKYYKTDGRRVWKQKDIAN